MKLVPLGIVVVAVVFGAEWTEKEARRILEDSPWVKVVSPGPKGDSGWGAPQIGPPRGMGGPPRGGMNSSDMGDSMSGMGGGDGMRGEGRGARAGGMRPMPKVTVAFESSRAVGTAKARIGAKDVFAGLRGEYVVVSVSGVPMLGGGLMAERLIAVTSMKVGQSKEYRPTEAKVEQRTAGAVVLFVFLREELEVGMGDGRLTFQTAVGVVEVTAKFDLRKMVFEGKLSL